MTDFSVPQRMSPAAFFIIFIKMVKTLFGAVFVYNLADLGINGRDALVTIAVSIGILIGASLILAAMAYFPKKYYIKDRNLIFSHGVLSRETTTVPLDRIHSLRTKQGIWYRLLGMRGIVVDTLASKGEELELILDEPDWQSLISFIERGESGATVSAHEPPPYNPTSTMRFGYKNLIMDALCQNHLKGMALFGGVLALANDFVNNITEETVETIFTYSESFLESLMVSTLRLAVFLAAIYGVILLLWLGNAILRYGDMTLVYDNRLLTFTHGLLSRSSCRFAFDKICTIWVKRNFLEKKLGLCTLALRQALNATAMKENENLKLYSRDISGFFLDWWLGKGYEDASTIAEAKSGRGAAIRAMLPDMPIIVVATIIFISFDLYIWLLLPAAYFAASVLMGISAMRHSRIVLKDKYLIVHAGRLAEIDNYIKYSDIEVVRIRRTPFTKLTRRVTLLLATSGSAFSIASLRDDEARQIYELILANPLSVQE